MRFDHHKAVGSLQSFGECVFANAKREVNLHFLMSCSTYEEEGIKLFDVAAAHFTSFQENDLDNLNYECALRIYLLYIN